VSLILRNAAVIGVTQRDWPLCLGPGCAEHRTGRTFASAAVLHRVRDTSNGYSKSVARMSNASSGSCIAPTPHVAALIRGTP